jgi:uncharacterized protein
MTANSPDSAPPVAWWSVPHMWLVVGGPVVVVIAAIATAVIAVKYQDPVLNKADYERDLSTASALEGKARDAALFNLLPANEGRNHATTRVPPSAK